MKFWSTQPFRELQKEWYERLRAEGFNDAEEMVGEEMVLRQNAQHVYRRATDEILRETKEAYFRFMAAKVHETVFQSEIDRFIMASHAQGKMIEAICEELEQMGERRARNTVRFKIRGYEMQWGLRHYTKKQLNKVS